MKTLKTVILTFSFLLCATILVKANPVPKAKRTLDYVLNKYIDCTSKGKIENFSKLLDNSFKIHINYNGKIQTYNKKEIVKFMKETENLLHNCNSTYTLVESNANFSIAKVEMEYPNFTRTDYITMRNNIDNEWIITNVFITYD